MRPPFAIPQVTIVVPGRWHAFDLARELVQFGALHRIVTNYPRSRTRRWNIPDAKVVSLPFTLMLTKFAWKLGGEKWAMRQNFRINDLFARRASRLLGSPDLVHGWSGASEPSLLAAKARGIATVLERSSAHMLEQCRILREEYAALGLLWEETPRATVERELREYEIADRVFVPSLFVERSFLDRGFSGERLFRNGFGVDLSRFAPGKKNDDVFRVIYAGSLSVRKGIHHLVRAFREANIPNSELMLVGGNMPESDQLIGPAEPRICRLGHVPQSELPAIYRSGSVFAMPSLEDGYGLVLLQAAACGLPLIASASTGGEDFLASSGAINVSNDGTKEFAAGYVVPTGNSLAIVDVLRELSAAPALLAEKRMAASTLAHRDLSWRRYAAANLDAYSAVLAAQRKDTR